ncbi:hypothetical protein GCK72_003153 [Caenorhabditis remanei]|uniref:F-box domain-containing protein n=1 Tax=Caenorhabditis remanei TaxID=31234 RepID=A0A6A5HXQ5_CAERE|nr:hypothetical protein GCK72_003153 [Caenorhabditis remanei]KAF1771327.1 hypothetical protein GCK72_003153 [Caenorhabditis remanei]
MPPFPLLRLPGVVLCEVFKSLSIGEKIKLSFCSKKTSAQINSARLYSQKVIVVLGMTGKVIRVYSENETVGFYIAICTEKIDDSNIHHAQIEGCTVPVTTTDSEPIKINTFWKDLKEGFLSITRHLLKIFHCKISTERDSWRHELFQPILTELFNQQQVFETISIGLHESVDHNWLNRIFTYSELVEGLEIPYLHSLPLSSFIPTFPPWPRQRITIKPNFSWLTLDTLFTCTCSDIYIARTNLENKDLDEILTHWKAGGLPNLEYLTIGSTKIKSDGDPILGIIPSEWEDETTIQTDDGLKTADVQLWQNYLEMQTLPQP